MYLNIIDWFNGLDSTRIVLLVIAAVLVIAIIAVLISSIFTARRIRQLKSRSDSEKAYSSEEHAQPALQPQSKADSGSIAEQAEQQHSVQPAQSDVQQAEQETEQAMQTEHSQSLAQQEAEQDAKAEPQAANDGQPAPAKTVKKPVVAAKKATSKPRADADTADKKPPAKQPVKTAAKPNTKAAKSMPDDSSDTAELEAGKAVAEVVEEIQSNDRKSGKLEIYKDDKDKFRFRIVSANYEPVGHSRSYATKYAARSGLKAMLKYSDTEVFDLTLLKNSYKPRIGVAAFEIFSVGDKFMFRLRSKNYRLVLGSQEYTTKGAANIGIEAVKRISENYTLEEK